MLLYEYRYCSQVHACFFNVFLFRPTRGAGRAEAGVGCFLHVVGWSQVPRLLLFTRNVCVVCVWRRNNLSNKCWREQTDGISNSRSSGTTRSHVRQYLEYHRCRFLQLIRINTLKCLLLPLLPVSQLSWIHVPNNFLVFRRLVTPISTSASVSRPRTIDPIVVPSMPSAAQASSTDSLTPTVFT